MRYYLLPISDREPLAWILSESRTAFPSHRRREADALAVGDKLLLYTTRGCFRNPTRDRGRVIGVATVESAVTELGTPMEFRGREFPLLVELSVDALAPLGRGIELAPLVARLRESFPKPTAWSATMRRALVPLAVGDGRKLVRLVRTQRDPNAMSSYLGAAAARS
jgi:hypothetical protein